MKYTLQRSKIARALALLLVMTMTLTIALGMGDFSPTDEDEGDETPIIEEVDTDATDTTDDETGSEEGASQGNNQGAPTDDDEVDETDDGNDGDTDASTDGDTGAKKDGGIDESQSDDAEHTEDDADYDVLMEPSSTQDANDAATLETLLEDTTTTVINVTQSIILNDAVALGGNKTIINNASTGVSINDAITGGFTITLGGADGSLAVGGTFDCSFVVTSGYLYFENTSALGAGKTITLGRVGEADGGSVVIRSSANFTNSGTIISHSGSVQVVGGGTFINSGTITLNGSSNLTVEASGTLTNGGTIAMNPVVIGGSSHVATIEIFGALNNNSGGTVTNNQGTIEVYSGGAFQLPTTLNNAEGLIRGVSASNFTGGFSLITFNANGGEFWSGRSIIVMAERSGIVFDLTKMSFWPERSDFALLGWFTQATGGTQIDMNRTNYPDPGNPGQTLYAQWVEATTAAELIAALQRTGDETITVKNPELNYTIVIEQNITLGGNKTIVAGSSVNGEYSYGVDIVIFGNISGSHALTVRYGALRVSQVVNCNITLVDGASFGNQGDSNTVLETGKIINVDSGLLQAAGGSFENKGTINLNDLFVVEESTFINRGTININTTEGTDEWGSWTHYAHVQIRQDGKFTNNGGTVNNKGIISSSSSGVFNMPSNFNNEGLIYGEKAANFGTGFDFLALNANGGHFSAWHPPSVTAVVAVPSGRAFDIAKINDLIWVWRDSGDGRDYFLAGWFTAATGGTRVDESNAATFARAGSTLYAQWTTGGFEDEVFIWEPTEEEIEARIEEAVDGNGVVEIHFRGTGAKAARLPKELFAAIDDAGEPLALRVEMPDGTITLDADALASLIEQIGDEDVTLTINQRGTSEIAALPDEQKAQIGTNDAVFSITLEAGGEFITQFDGLITITLPWDGRFPAVVWYLAANGNLSRMATTYNETAKLVTFTTDHLSIYLIRYAPPGSNNSARAGSPQTGDYSTMLFPIILVALGTLGITGWFLHGKRSAKKK